MRPLSHVSHIQGTAIVGYVLYTSYSYAYPRYILKLLNIDRCAFKEIF